MHKNRLLIVLLDSLAISVSEKVSNPLSLLDNAGAYKLKGTYKKVEDNSPDEEA